MVFTFVSGHRTRRWPAFHTPIFFCHFQDTEGELIFSTLTEILMVYAANSFDSSYFNSLPSIESAHDIASSNLSANLELMAPIFFRHSMQDSWGIALLHKHWDVKASEIPIQEAYISEDTKHYITQPRTSDYNHNAWPSTLSLAPSSSGEVQSLEFTACGIAQSKYDDLIDKPAFIKELQSVLAANNLLGTFGIVQGRETAPGYQLVENSPEGRMSILTEVSVKESNSQSLIQTAWFFSANLKGMQCVAHCGKACLVN